MIYVTANTPSRWMLWQVQVQHWNFYNLGVDLKNVYNLVVYKDNDYLDEYKKYADYSPANIIFIKDDCNPNIRNKYVPSIKPYAYYRLLDIYPNLINEKWFILDQDVVFRELLDFSLMADDKIYLSDTISYIGASYIKSKKDNLLERGCETVGINSNLVEKYQCKSGGAQIYGKCLHPKYWVKIEEDSFKLYDVFSESRNSKRSDIQSWCAEMWTTLWNMWLFGYDTEIHKEMEFCWAGDSIHKYNKIKILHNTGLANHKKKIDIFNRSDYGNRLINEIPQRSINPESVTYAYYQMVLSTKQYIKQLYSNDIPRS